MKTFPNNYLMKRVEHEIGQGNSVRIRLVGRSMQPFLHEDGDLLTIGPCSSKELKRGEIVLAHADGQYYLHRIISLHNDSVRLCGDAICNSFELIPTSGIVGRLRNVERQGEIINCNALHWRFKGLVWMWLFPIRPYLLILHRCVKRVKPQSKIRSKKAYKKE